MRVLELEEMLSVSGGWCRPKSVKKVRCGGSKHWGKKSGKDSCKSSGKDSGKDSGKAWCKPRPSCKPPVTPPAPIFN